MPAARLNRSLHAAKRGFNCRHPNRACAFRAADVDLQPEAVMLDLVNPAIGRAYRRLFLKGTHNARGRTGAHVIAELLHDRLVVLRQGLRPLFRPNLHYLVAADLQLSEKVW